MNKFWIIYLLVLWPMFSGWSGASIPKESESSGPAHSFYFAIDLQVPAVKETAALIRKGLEDLGAGAIRGIFILPREGSLPSEYETASVAFVGTEGECFIYDSVTKKTVMCEEKLLVSEEFLLSSLAYPPVLLSQESLQVAGLGDWICSHKIEMAIGMGMLGLGIVTGPMGLAMREAFLQKVGIGEIRELVTTAGILTGVMALIAGTSIATLETTNSPEMKTRMTEFAIGSGIAMTTGFTVGTAIGAGAGLLGVGMGAGLLAGVAIGAAGIGAMYYFCPARG